ncbi:MAG: amidohydrolase [Planctomycetota bacterium]|nr:MAG: amidohydrolase [Planctomycetota bacterium]
MSDTLQQRILDELNSQVLIDPHTHINPHSPTSTSLADILGYHYYTELAHSSGMPREYIEAPGLSPKEKVGRLVEAMDRLDNTVQLSWLLEAARTLFDVDIDRLDASNWESLYDAVQAHVEAPDWEDLVLGKSKLEAVFLTNDFDDPLEGFDTTRYIPCLRTDDLVFHLARPQVRQRLAASSQMEIGSIDDVANAIGKRFEHFVGRGARACAISLPPHFTPAPIPDSDAHSAWLEISAINESTGRDAQLTLGYWVFWKIAQYCAEFNLPLDLMIGVNRSVYPAGVYQGQDLYDSRVSLIQYKELFNAFPQVRFPISVLASVTNQELVSYAWIFPNVICHGHWWYSNTPSFILRDVTARLEAVPRNKIIGYYSDMYKLEFAQPKFAMYKRVLARALADHFVIGMGWSESRAIDLGRQVLRGNVETTFGRP